VQSEIVPFKALHHFFHFFFQKKKHPTSEHETPKKEKDLSPNKRHPKA
jgi:hypothetical protein